MSRVILNAWTVGLFFSVASVASAFFTTIVVDGSFKDWNDVPFAVADVEGDNDGAGPDLASLQIANDETNLYLRIVYHKPVNPNAGPSVFVALDSDVDAATGFNVFGRGLVGAEAGWQNDFPFQQRADAFNAGGIEGGAAKIAPYATTTTSQEYSLWLGSVFTGDGSRVFAHDTFRLLIYTDPTGANELMGPVTYTLSRSAAAQDNANAGGGPHPGP